MASFINSQKFKDAFRVAQVPDDATRAVRVLIGKSRRGDDPGSVGEIRASEHVDNLDIPALAAGRGAKALKILLGAAGARRVTRDIKP
jgi:hypothetical protein